MKALVRAWLLSLTLAIGAGICQGPLLAAAQDEPDPAAERAASFEAAEGAQTENIPGGLLMVVAYGAVLLLVLGYAASLGLRQAKTQRELERLGQDLKAHERKAASGAAPSEER